METIDPMAQLFDPALMEQYRATLEPPPEAKRAAGMDALLALGLGLHGNRSSHLGVAIGNAGVGAMGAHRYALDTERQNRMGEIQGAMGLRKLSNDINQEQERDKAFNDWLATQPAEKQAAARAAYLGSPESWAKFMAEQQFPKMEPYTRTWSATSWASSPRPAPSGGMSSATRPPSRRRRQSSRRRWLKHRDVKAVGRFIPVSTRKTRLVVDMIRGRSANEAMDVLRFMHNAGSDPVAKVLRSAIANADQNYGLSRDDLFVFTAAADEGPTRRWRRFGALVVGSSRFRSSSHITIVARTRPGRRVGQGRGARMGRKVHPIGFRLGINKPWESRWCANRGSYAKQLHEDGSIRKLILKAAPRSGISRIDIERFPNNVHVTIQRAAG